MADNIYKLNEKIEACLNLWEQGFDEIVDTETGMVMTLQECLEELQATKQEKIDNLAKYIKNTNAFIESLQGAKKELEERIKRKKARVENAMEYLENVLQGEKVENEYYVISYNPRESVDIKKGAFIPEQYRLPQEPTEPKPDKKALKKAIKNGEKFEGITLVKNMNMSVK